PIQSIGFLTWIWFRHSSSLWPYWPVGPYLHLGNLTQFSRVDPTLNHFMQRIRSSLVPHLGHYLFFTSQLSKHSCLPNIVGHRFLNINMFSSFHGVFSCWSVNVIRSRNSYGI